MVRWPLDMNGRVKLNRILGIRLFTGAFVFCVLPVGQGFAENPNFTIATMTSMGGTGFFRLSRFPVLTDGPVASIGDEYQSLQTQRLWSRLFEQLK